MQSIILLYIKETDGRPADGAIQSRNIAELPTYNSTLACQWLFLRQVKRPHKGLGGSPQSQEYEGVNAYCQMHCAP